MNTRAPNPQHGVSAAGRRAFTLIELLVVMVIIALLSSMVLAGLFSATESARHAKTKSTIAKIHGQIVQHWDSYRTRRLPISIAPGESAQAFAARRLMALWTLQRIEMPDTYDDILLVPSSIDGSFAQMDSNSLHLAYRARTSSGDNVSAKCLYLMVTLGMNDNDEVRFLESEVKDTDQDGIPDVFVDGWGRPIRWIRWAPGYVPRLGADSDIQRDDPPGSPAPSLGFQADPFDTRAFCQPGSNAPATVQFPPSTPRFTFNARPPPGNSTNYYGFKLMPLVYSLGPDGESGIAEPTGNGAWHPYAYYPESTPTYIGVSMTDKPRGTPIVGLEGGGHLDNITNHRLGTR